jgi:hypothetical protein
VLSFGIVAVTGDNFRGVRDRDCSASVMRLDSRVVYFLEVVAGHIIFFWRNVDVPSEAIHLKLTAIGLPLVVGILPYLWLRGRPLLR